MTVGFANIKTMVEAENDGQVRYATWRKSPTQATTIGVWYDLSMSPGNPIPQYYAASPLNAIALRRSTDFGLDHGQNATNSKHLRKVMAMSSSATPLPMPMMLLDYVMFYPFCDEGSTDLQTMVNANQLSRYADGAGLQIMAVSVATPIGGQTFQVGYTNSRGVSGRLTDVVRMNAAAYVGAIAGSDRAVAGARGPFLPLQGSDTGVRSIDSFQMISNTDIGLITLALVKPLGQMSIRGIDAPVEIDYFKDLGGLVPKIENDAYLNFICCPSGSLSGVTITGEITTVWS